MAITGNWTLFYDWNCDGSYSKAQMTIQPNGRFTLSEGFSGPWIQVAGMFIFTFDNSDTTYAGDFADKSITGISTTFGGLNGCFYLPQEGVPATFAAERAAGKPNARGERNVSQP
jgi:hypothetical protein